MSSKDPDSHRLPTSYRRSFRWILEPIEELRRDPVALAEQPATVLARLSRRMERRLSRELEVHGREEFVRRLFVHMASAPSSEWEKAERRMIAHLRAERRRICRRPGGAALIALLVSADSTVRNGPFLVIPHPISHGKAALTAWGRIVAVHGTRGEVRATTVLASAHAVWEQVYQPYLQALWKLAEISKGRVPGEPPKQGRLVQELVRRLGHRYEQLVDADAVRIRNAVAHARAEYLPGKHAVLLHNSDGWTLTISVRELAARVHRWFAVSTRVHKAAFDLFVGDVFLTPLLPHLPALTHAIVARDTAELQRLAPVVKALLDGQCRGPTRLFTHD